MANRDVTILIKKRQSTGGSVPGTALMGEPFVNLFDGILKFSATTGGSFEPSSQTNVFEVGSNLYNQRISNRLNINNNFIISGNTGTISTYQGTTGAGLAGKFLSGTSAGLILADIADIATTTDSYTTGATWVPNTLTLKLNNGKPDVSVVIGTFDNLTVTGNTNLNTLYATTVSGGTIYSANTDIYSIFVNKVNEGSNTTIGGTSISPTVSVVGSPSFNNITYSGTSTGGNSVATNVSATTSFYSAGTSLETIIYNIANSTENITSIANGLNTYTGGTQTAPTVNVSAATLNNLTVSGSTNLSNTIISSLSASNLTNGRVVLAGTAGYVTDDSNLTFNPGTSVLTIAGSGNLTTNGTQYSGGTIVDDGIFTIDATTNVQIDSALLPTTHLTYNLGAIGQRWDRVYARSFHAGISSTEYGDGYITGDSGTFIFNAGNLSVNGNINPSASTTYNLGTAGLRWNSYYGKDMDLTGALTVTGITNSGLVAGQAVYAGPGGLLKSNSGFTYDDLSKTLYSENIQIGTPSLSGNVDIWGDVIVHGQSISAFTSQLYIEDNNIILNFNPTANTTSTSLGAGFTIQDGSGTAGTDVFLDIRGTATGVANRSFATNLNDIRIRETGTVSSPNGVRLLAEQDVLDGGTF